MTKGPETFRSWGCICIERLALQDLHRATCLAGVWPATSPHCFPLLLFCRSPTQSAHMDLSPAQSTPEPLAAHPAILREVSGVVCIHFPFFVLKGNLSLLDMPSRLFAGGLSKWKVMFDGTFLGTVKKLGLHAT